MNRLIQQGAEAKIFLDKDIISKNRIPKGYRHSQLDTLIRTRRTKSEGKILFKALNFGIQVPKVLNANQKGEPREKFDLEIEYIDGDKLSETLNSYPEQKQFEVMKKLGEQVAKLHENNIIHGDLTTSNIILTAPGGNAALDMRSKASPNSPPQAPESLRSQFSVLSSQFSVFIIDFGLGFISTKIEDKAVDLHLIKQALEAKHFRSPDHLRGQNHEDLFENFLKTYKDKEVIERLKVVEKRGRYKH